ncbi:MAG: GAF domain-containing sensor histidine kinase [Candidatus Limnocylindria bacterium]
MKPPDSPAATEPHSAHRMLVLPPLLEAIDAWQAQPTAERRQELGHVLQRVARQMGLAVGRLRVNAPPLADLDLDLDDGTAGAEFALRVSGNAQPIGLARISGDHEQAAAMARALERGFLAARVRAQAERATSQLTALDQAVRGISGVLDVDRVLQLITDRVRDLVNAQYAALGIVNSDGTIERFITSGISDEDRERIGDLPHGRGLLGLIIRENRTYRIPDMGSHPERYGFPPHHPEMHSFLGMPITASGAVVGRLYLTNKLDAAEFSAEDQSLVEMFALHAGIAIENARLHDQVRRLAIVDERDRISRDLHDSVIQAIYGQTLALDDVPELIGEDPDEATRRVDEAIDALHAVIRDIRNFIFGLRPVLLESGSLTDGLRHLATELHRNGGVEVSVSIADDAEVDLMPIEVVAELLAVTREALSNIARHASATHASVVLTSTSDEFRLELGDNGRGFDAARVPERGHHGLANMRARSETLGGAFDIQSSADAGTRIIISLPRHTASARRIEQ